MSPIGELSCDVVIVGRGPAEASTGRLLSVGGHSVIILTKGNDPRPSLAESLPPSCRGVFETVVPELFRRSAC